MTELTSSGTVQWGVEATEITGSITPEGIFDALFADKPHAFWLDSSRQAYDMGQWSYLGAPTADAQRIEQRGGAVRIFRGEQEKTSELSAISYLSEILAQRKIAPGQMPFLGGFIGYFGYGCAGHDVQPRSDPHGADAIWWEVQQYLAFQHQSQRLYAVTCGPAGAELTTRNAAWAENVRSVLAQYPGLPPVPQAPAAEVVTPSVNQKEYLRDLAVVQSWLTAGDSYEACYTYQLQVPQVEPSWIGYRRLRELNPAPYSAYLAMGDRQLMSSSPERFLRVEPTGWVETKPIKGTIARAENEAEDTQRAKQLANDPKSLSENLMIVDLLRNDLYRICQSGTVTVPKLMAIETYQTVHQLVTTVRGKVANLRPDFYFPSLFPGGSMTGAPKKRTVELLEGLEAVPRGVYSGVLGYFSFTGAADLSIVIRTAVSDSGTVRIGTGGAITVQSDPEAE